MCARVWVPRVHVWLGIAPDPGWWEYRLELVPVYRCGGARQRLNACNNSELDACRRCGGAQQHLG